MRRTGTADLPLHGGRAPSWLFGRMTRLARAIVLALREDEPAEAILRRFSDPHWFQAFGSLLGFDWHSSGLTTTVCGALKEAMRGIDADVGLFVAGGKGATSRKAPAEIQHAAGALGRDPAPLVYASRMAAKVDSAGLQDGGSVLNFVAGEGGAHRDAVAALVRTERPETIVAEVDRAQTLSLPARHHVDLREDVSPRHLAKVLLETYERRPDGFEALLGQPGVGAKTMRALSLAAEVMYGVPASLRDPAVYAFAHGGKDGHPYPVDRSTYDRTIACLEASVRRPRLGEPDRLAALRRLAEHSRSAHGR